MLALAAALVLSSYQFGFDWDVSGENGPLSDFSMTANFSSRAEPFEGPVPDKPDVTVPKGGRVFARINVRFVVDDSGGEPEEIWSSMCGNVCQGPPPNHASHADCNRFCDRLCEGQHKFQSQKHEGFVGWKLERLEKPFTEGFAAAARLLRDRSLSVDSNMDWLLSIRDEFIAKANEKAEKEMFTYEPPHYGRDPYLPCTIAKFVVWGRRERIVAFIDSFLVFQEKRGNEFVTLAQVPFGEQDGYQVADGYTCVTNSGTLPEVKCLCGDHASAHTPDLPALALGMTYRSFPISKPGTPFQALQKDMAWRNMQVSVAGENMVLCSVNVSGDPTAQAFLPAGTLLIPDDKGDQIMVLMEDYNGVLAAGPLAADSKVRVACTEVAKHEPDPKTKFAIAAGTDGNLRRLAKIAAKSRFRGPWDQVRIWMYTDGATYEEIEKRLIPMVAKPTYLLELDRVLRGGIDPAKRKKLLDSISLDMISDFRCGPEGLTRALPVLWKKDSKKFLAAVPGYASKWLNDSGTGVGVEMVSALAYFLGVKRQPEARAAARAILTGVPEGSRAKILERGGLESVSAGVFAKEKEEIRATVDLLKSYGGSAYAKTIAFGEARMN